MDHVFAPLMLPQGCQGMAGTCQYIPMLTLHSMIDTLSMFVDGRVLIQLPVLLDKGSQNYAILPFHLFICLGTETKYLIWDTRNVLIQKKVKYKHILMYLGEQELLAQVM